VFQDFIESSIQSYQFYFSESLLFKVYLILFFPFGILLFKYILRWKEEKSYSAMLLLTFAITLSHLILNGVLVNLFSKLLLDHQYSILGVILNSISSQLYIYFLVYAFLIVIAHLISPKANLTHELIKTYRGNILIEHGRKKTIIAVQDIETIQTEKPYVMIYTEESKQLYSSSLKLLITELNPNHFIRIHKSCIVNLMKVLEMKSRLNGDYDLTLLSGKVIRLSRNYAADFKDKFENKSSS
jgi:DNA-binding LytR/AlgR family response regulator